MGKISIDLNSFKAAGVYTLEVDNTARVAEESNDSLRMLVGFSNKGPFNRPVLLTEDADRLRIFGDADTKLEHKGSFFNRMLKTLVAGGPVIALNLLNVDKSYTGPDQVNLAAMSMDAGTANPRVADAGTYGEYDYLAESIDNMVYRTKKGDNLPYVGKTPFASVYNRSRFWVPDKDLLTAEAARILNTTVENSSLINIPTYNSFENSNLLNFANVGTDEISILVFKPASMPGYEVTAETWFGGRENIPFGWIRPYDNISDYFLQVVCVKGNWSNYPVLSTDPVWKGYFNKNGIIKNRINHFMGADGVTILGSWTGCIIPDFTDKQGNMLNLEKKVNAATERTGLLMAFNNDLANVLTYDYSGFDTTSANPGKGCWGLDIDGNSEVGDGETKAKYIVDMVGHQVFMNTPDVPVEKWEDGAQINKDPSIEKGQYIYNKSRNKFYIVDSSLYLFDLIDGGKEIGVYNSSVLSSFDSSIRPAVYVDSSLFYIEKPTDASGNKVKYSAAAILDKVMAVKTYDISENGVISKPAVLNVSKVDKMVNSSVVNASVFFTLNEKEYCQELTINTDPITNYITSVTGTLKAKVEKTTEGVNGINFLSYNYVKDSSNNIIEKISSVKRFSDSSLWDGEMPISIDTKNMFIIFNAEEWTDSKIKLGDYVKNITYNNNEGETEEYQLIPGLTKVIKKQFITVNNGKITYQGKPYAFNDAYSDIINNKKGFYLITCTSPVLIEDDTVERQLPISDDRISGSLRFIPMKGLTITSKHRPGYDANGNLNIEEGIEKVYSVLNDEGIKRGLMNPAMVDYRYIIDSMSYGLGPELGGKVWLSRTAQERGKCTAILNLPSAKQFAVSSNPYFCDTYNLGAEARPSMNTKYIPEGGNTEMGSSVIFSLPSEEDGAKFTACFWPHLVYQENGKEIVVPPAADVANVLNRKFNGINDPYAISANQNGILSNRYLKGLEFLADLTDREYLEPFGVNTIIKDQGSIMIYGNQTAYQAMKSDFNKLHVRENLNTAEIECEKVLKKYNFLYNTPAVRANIVQQLTPVLSSMQISGALVKYEIICDETNNTAEVIEADTCVVEINLWMNHGMEKIVQKFTLQRLSDQ